MGVFSGLMRMVAIFFLIITTNISFAAKNSLLGGWQSHDEKSGKPTSLITIWQKGDKYFGKISQIYPVGGANNKDVCLPCKGERHNKPILGMTIIHNMQQEGKKFTKGMILDPRNGKEYRCVLAPSADGKKLFVRGFIGFSLFGRTTVWTRAS